jgi:hypothetical protein
MMETQTAAVRRIATTKRSAARRVIALLNPERVTALT